jgi:hypothetical protein
VKANSALRESIKERTAVGNETHEHHFFDIENCRAKKRMADLVDCLSPQQAHLCGFSVGFGEGYFCNHPRRNELIEITKKLQNNVNPLSGAAQSEDQG